MHEASLIKDDLAVEGLPIRLLVSVVLLAVVVSIAASALSSFLAGSDEQLLLAEMDKILTRSESMFAGGGARDLNMSGDFGAKQHVRVEIPGGVRFVVFGAMPRGADAPIVRSPTESNNYYYVMGDARIQTGSSSALFVGYDGINFDPGRPVVLYPGLYDLTLELVKYSGKSYVMIY